MIPLPRTRGPRLARAARRVRRAAQRPAEVQAELLRLIVDAAADSEFGRRHRLAAVDSIESFRRHVPPCTRAESRFDLDRTAAGAPDVLLPGRAIGSRTTLWRGPGDLSAGLIGLDGPIAAAAVARFAREAGLAPDDRLVVPVTARCRGRAARDAVAAWFHVAGLAAPGCLDGAILVGPPPHAGPVRTVRDAGPVLPAPPRPPSGRRGHVDELLPASVGRRRAVPAAVAEIIAGMPDDDERRRLAMRFALAADVRLIIGGDVVELVAGLAAANTASDALIRDIRDGTVRSVPTLDRETRRRLEAMVAPDRDRARALDRARDGREGRLLPCDAWSVAAVGMLAQGGAAASVQAALQPWFDPRERGSMPAVLDLGWLTAEVHATTIAATADPEAAAPGPHAAHAAHDVDDADDAGPAGLPLAELAFHEYVDVAEMLAAPEAPDRWTWRGLDQLDAGPRYARFVTTWGGLWRLETLDAVEVAGTVDGATLLRPAGAAPGLFDLDG